MVPKHIKYTRHKKMFISEQVYTKWQTLNETKTSMSFGCLHLFTTRMYCSFAYNVKSVFTWSKGSTLKNENQEILFWVIAIWSYQEFVSFSISTSSVVQFCRITCFAAKWEKSRVEKQILALLFVQWKKCRLFHN